MSTEDARLRELAEMNRQVEEAHKAATAADMEHRRLLAARSEMAGGHLEESTEIRIGETVIEFTQMVGWGDNKRPQKRLAIASGAYYQQFGSNGEPRLKVVGRRITKISARSMHERHRAEGWTHEGVMQGKRIDDLVDSDRVRIVGHVSDRLWREKGYGDRQPYVIAYKLEFTE